MRCLVYGIKYKLPREIKKTIPERILELIKECDMSQKRLPCQCDETIAEEKQKMTEH